MDAEDAVNPSEPEVMRDVVAQGKEMMPIQHQAREAALRGAAEAPRKRRFSWLRHPKH